MENEHGLELKRLELEIKQLRERLYLYQSEPNLTKQSIVNLSEKLDEKIIQFMYLNNQSY